MLIQLAWRNIWRNKRRTLITAASVFFAVLLAIAMRALQEGSYDKMIENVVSFYSGFAQIHQHEYWDEPTLEHSFEWSEDQPVLQASQPEVTRVIPRLESFALASTGQMTEGCMVVGTDPQREALLTGLDDKIVSGTYFEDSTDGLILAKGLSEKLSLAVGDTLVLLGQGFRGYTAAGKYPVTGIAKFGSPDLNDRMVFLPLSVAQDFYGAYSRVTSLALQLEDPQRATQVAEKLNQELDSTYHVMDWQSMMPELVQTIEVDRQSGIITNGVLYMIIAFGIFGTVIMMTAERQYEYGILSAIGMKKWKIAVMTTLEIIFIALLGAVAGTLASLPLVAYFQAHPIRMGEELSEAYAAFGMEAVFPMAMDPPIFFNQSLLVLIVSLIVCIYPVFKIFRLTPVEAMKG